MKTNVVIDVSPPVPCLAKFWFLRYESKLCLTVKLQDSLMNSISRKKCKMILSFWV